MHATYDAFCKLERSITEFEITEQHLNLLRNAHVSWAATEFGAPEINPKRPYGNSNVPEDVAELVVPGFVGWGYEARETYVNINERDLTRLHVETAIALQIILRIGEFRTGRFRRSSWYGEWKPDGATPTKSEDTNE